MRVIITAEPDEMEYAMGLVVDAFATFARHPERIGWGWTFCKPGKRSFFISRTKGGFSARPAGQGSVALVSSRTERDLPVIVSIEMSSDGVQLTREEGAALTSSLQEALGDEAASRLAQDGALPVTLPNAESATALVEAITALGAKYAHFVRLNAWRS